MVADTASYQSTATNDKRRQTLGRLENMSILRLLSDVRRSDRDALDYWPDHRRATGTVSNSEKHKDWEKLRSFMSSSEVSKNNPFHQTNPIMFVNGSNLE
jgi:hypothetical protein